MCPSKRMSRIKGLWIIYGCWPLHVAIQQSHNYLMSIYYKPHTGMAKTILMSIRVSKLLNKKQEYMHPNRPFLSTYCVPGGNSPGTEKQSCIGLKHDPAGTHSKAGMERRQALGRLSWPCQQHIRQRRSSFPYLLCRREAGPGGKA